MVNLFAIIGVAVAHVDYCRLNNLAECLKRALKALFGADFFKVCGRSQVRQQFHTSLVEKLNLLAEERRRHVRSVVFAVLNHTFLANILRAGKQKDVLWVHAILHKELSLELRLREILKHNAGGYLLAEAANECTHYSLFVSFT